MGKSVNVQRQVGHPWDDRPGFDLMTIDADTGQERDKLVRDAESKYWKPWIVGFNTGNNDMPSAVFYKPSGLNAAWTDLPDQPHPGCINGVEIDPPKGSRALMRQRG